MDLVRPFQDAFGTFLSYVPQLVGALILLLIGYIVAKVLAGVIQRILGKVGFDRLMDRAGVSSFLQQAGSNLTPSVVFGKLVFWFIFIIAFTMFASALGVSEISGFLNQMIAYIPRIFAAVAILFLAVLLANFIAALIRGATGNDGLARVGRYAIIVYAAFAALTQLGIAVQLTGNTLLIALAGIALAFGIAFGWGGRDIARDMLNRAFVGSNETRQAPGYEPGTSGPSDQPGGTTQPGDPGR